MMTQGCLEARQRSMLHLKQAAGGMSTRRSCAGLRKAPSSMRWLAAEIIYISLLTSSSDENNMPTCAHMSHIRGVSV